MRAIVDYHEPLSERTRRERYEKVMGVIWSTFEAIAFAFILFTAIDIVEELGKTTHIQEQLAGGEREAQE